MTMPLVAVPADFRRFERYDWHAVPAQYLDAARIGAGCLPLVVPAFEAGIDIGSVISRVDGVLVTGARSNVHPSRYGEAETEAHAPFDPARDAVSLPLITGAIERGMPLLAICRGIQELNVALGGSLDPRVHELTDRSDHREEQSDDNDVRFAIRQDVSVEAGGCLARVVGAGTIRVNSLHNQGIARLSDRLSAEAHAPDGTIEAVSVKDAAGFALGVQWHPEYWVRDDGPSRAIFEAFGKAVRDYADANRRAEAAE
ncbi:gamma-glutamyl-gamma-aminobutyrate hydrolase family protein [Pararhizobium mangrovi]|uniref:gamma-glutamyl-gamma-aminobutyrate hydrolase n=1 Tax=Pararhizobium mangrovi TaxID=2590452 RepID=A0A506UD00_9HYPH|nr:gamma-glutamyl-gamma-aminobutyrate hydrolase family protein [Pararhizobium mangrovi]TPW30675.1 gamma-glutamyl-gamma-aminobutyrate hydrolase family protein [Pararhizobium mangrovi]